MTPPVEQYFAKKQPVRKKEPQYVAFINKNSCTSCTSCASMCPVDCIFEVEGAPSESYHQVDLSRCIGCQMCYRVPSESTGPWTMEICPWNAIDLIYNPNFKEKTGGGEEREPLLKPYYAGEGTVNFQKLEEIGYQLYLNRLMHIQKGSPYEKEIEPLTQSNWSFGDDEKFAIVQMDRTEPGGEVFVVTPLGDALVGQLFNNYQHMFLD